MCKKTNPVQRSISSVEENRVSLLSNKERRELAQNEAVIEKGFRAFLEVGAALLRIKDKRLYRETHATFEGYCREKFEMTRMNAYRKIHAVEICAMLPNGVTPRPTNEAQLRPLTVVPREKVSQLWLKTVRDAGDNRITARLVEKTVSEWRKQHGEVKVTTRLSYWQEQILTHLKTIKQHTMDESRDGIAAELERIKLLVEESALDHITMTHDGV